MMLQYGHAKIVAATKSIQKCMSHIVRSTEIHVEFIWNVCGIWREFICGIHSGRRKMQTMHWLVIVYFGSEKNMVLFLLISSSLYFIKPWKGKTTWYIFNRSAQNMSIGFLTRVKICFPILFPKQRCIDALSDDAFAERLRTPLGPICLISSFSDATVSNIS